MPGKFIPAVEKGVVAAMEEGVLAGYPVVDVRVTLYDGSYHTVDSSEQAFKVAGSMGFKKAVGEARMVLLEPIMNVEIKVPEDFMGDVMGDLSGRRGKIQGMDTAGQVQRDQGAGPARRALPVFDAPPVDDAGARDPQTRVLPLRGSAARRGAEDRGRSEEGKGTRGLSADERFREVEKCQVIRNGRRSNGKRARKTPPGESSSRSSSVRSPCPRARAAGIPRGTPG